MNGGRERGGQSSLFEGLVDGGVGVQAGGTGVHELGGVVRRHGAHAVGLAGVGDAGHDGHHLRNLLLQLLDLLLLLHNLTCRQEWQSVRKRKGERKSGMWVFLCVVPTGCK